MGGPVVYVDTSEIRAGKLEELRRGLEGLATFIEEREPQLLSYAAFVHETGTTVTVVHVHADAASLELHMQVAGPRFKPFVELVRLRSIDVYGEVTPATRKALDDKARLLGDGATVRVHDQLAGFVRAPLATPSSGRGTS